MHHFVITGIQISTRLVLRWTARCHNDHTGDFSNCRLKICTVLIFFFFCINANAQEAPPLEWDRRYGGTGVDEIRSVFPCNDGGLLLAGSMNNLRDQTRKAWLAKLDRFGSYLWEKKYGEELSQEVRAIVQMEDGRIILALRVEDPGQMDSYYSQFMILDDLGDIKLATTIKGEGWDEINDMIILRDGTIAVCGTLDKRDPEHSDAFFMRFDLMGNILSEGRYGGQLKDQCFSMLERMDGTILLSGTKEVEPGNNDAWLIAIHPDGTEIWDQLYMGADYDAIVAAKELYDGHIVLAGTTRSEGAGNNDAWLIFLAPNYRPLWDKTFGGQAWDNAAGIVEMPDGSMTLLATTNSFGFGYQDGWALNINRQGQTIWEKYIGTADRERCFDATILNDGGIIGVGSVYTQGYRGYDAWVFKLKTDKPIVSPLPFIGE